MPTTRRGFVACVGAATLFRGPRHPPAAPPAGGGPDEWRRRFPALGQRIGGHRFTYLDSAATTLRPDAVIDELAAFHRSDDANPSPALHAIARRAHERYESARAD